MDLTVTYAQFKAVRSALGVQALVLFSPDSNIPTLVRRAAVLDPKMGGASFSWATDADKPLITTFLADFSAAIEVADIT